LLAVAVPRRKRDEPTPLGAPDRARLRLGLCDAHDTYNGIGAASDGRIYYVLSSERHDVAAQMFVLDPASGRPRRVADLDEATGQKGRHVIAQGKSHVNFVEAGGKLYFATHIGFYSIVDGMETMGIPPRASRAIRAGTCSPTTWQRAGSTTSPTAPSRKASDHERRWAAAAHLRADLAQRRVLPLRRRVPRVQDLGRFFEKGENGKGRSTARSAARSPSIRKTARCTSRAARARSSATATIGRRSSPVAGDDLKKDYSANTIPTSPGTWPTTGGRRRTAPRTAASTACTGTRGTCSRSIPRAERVEVLDRITSEPFTAQRMFDQFSYGYLGFTLGPGRAARCIT
jgi:hypothetical protein